MPVLIGTSGWQYRDWRGVLYPPGLAERDWLEYYAGRYGTVENNGTFYRLPATDTFAAWRAKVPEGFVMTVKALRSWVQRAGEAWPDSADVFVYFNNDQHAAALYDAASFAKIARRAGRQVTLVPEPEPWPDHR